MVTAAPLSRRATDTLAASATENIDVVILNYALTLEHLEEAFYRKGLELYDSQKCAHLLLGLKVRRRVLI